MGRGACASARSGLPGRANGPREGIVDDADARWTNSPVHCEPDGQRRNGTLGQRASGRRFATWRAKSPNATRSAQDRSEIEGIRGRLNP